MSRSNDIKGVRFIRRGIEIRFGCLCSIWRVGGNLWRILTVFWDFIGRFRLVCSWFGTFWRNLSFFEWNFVLLGPEFLILCECLGCFAGFRSSLGRTDLFPLGWKQGDRRLIFLFLGWIWAVFCTEFGRIFWGFSLLWYFGFR